MEEGGHPGTNELPTMLMGALAADQFRVPVVLGGGIGHGRQLAAVLAQGLDGVMIGSRFLVCEEIGAHRDYKQHLLGCDENSSLPGAGNVKQRLPFLDCHFADRAALGLSGVGSL